MDPEDRDLLERTFKLARDNNRMLQAMNRAALFNGLFRVLAWIAVLALAAWLYFNYLGPVLNSATHALNQAQTASSNASSELQSIQNAISAIQHVIPSFSTSTATSTQ
ncbi:MAG TPA: hypothetical protein VFL98_02140 [Candidatus Paceibacterota bacterium]|nr:hypothetical protein [Candidatus Paceibacterota bacterium]